MTFPDFILTCLGTHKDFEKIEHLLGRHKNTKFEIDKQFSVFQNDSRMEAAFEISEPPHDPTLTAKDKKSIKQHSAVTYIIIKSISEANKIKTLQDVLALIGDLIEEKLVTAIKCDRSGITHGLTAWSEMATAAKAGNSREVMKTLYRAFVLKPMDDGEFFYTLGMHLFGKPDFIFEDDDLDEDLALKVMEQAFELSIVDPKAKTKIKLSKPKMGVEIYSEGEIYFNPYGYQKIQA